MAARSLRNNTKTFFRLNSWIVLQLIVLLFNNKWKNKADEKLIIHCINWTLTRKKIAAMVVGGVQGKL
jgi:hypothetical protein